MERNRFTLQMNRGLSACLLGKLMSRSPSSLCSIYTCADGLRCLPANADHFVLLKKVLYVGGRIAYILPFLLNLFLIWSFRYVSHLLEPIVTVRCLMAGFQGLSLSTHFKCYPNTVWLLSQWGQCHFPGVTLLAQRLQGTMCGCRYIERGKRGDREMREH